MASKTIRRLTNKDFLDMAHFAYGMYGHGHNAVMAVESENTFQNNPQVVFLFVPTILRQQDRLRGFPNGIRYKSPRILYVLDPREFESIDDFMLFVGKTSK